jgi:hypothetical protein
LPPFLLGVPPINVAKTKRGRKEGRDGYLPGWESQQVRDIHTGKRWMD